MQILKEGKKFKLVHYRVNSKKVQHFLAVLPVKVKGLAGWKKKWEVDPSNQNGLKKTEKEALNFLSELEGVDKKETPKKGEAKEKKD